MTDRQTKLLLVLIALALWGLLLQSIVGSRIVQAAPAPTPNGYAATSNAEGVFVVANGKITLWHYTKGVLVKADESNLP